MCQCIIHAEDGMRDIGMTVLQTWTITMCRSGYPARHAAGRRDPLDRRDISFFFSSRSRHTRYWRDWSSDVCSSDLREEDHHASEEEENSEPVTYLVAEDPGLLVDERDVGLSRDGRLSYDRPDEHREHDEREGADEEEGDEVFPVGHLPPVPPAAHVLLVHREGVPQRGGGHLFTRDRGDDLGHAPAHPEALVPDVVALGQVVGPAGAREGHGAKERGDTDRSDGPRYPRDGRGSLRDDARPGR